MQRDALPNDLVPYSDYLDQSYAYIYYAREWFFEGYRGESGRTAVVCFLKSDADRCRHVVRVKHWNRNNKSHATRELTLCDEEVACTTFDRYAQRLVKHGMLAIPNQDVNYSMAHIGDVLGIQLHPQQQNWYTLVGTTHYTDARHKKYILPFFMSRVGLGPYLDRLNHNKL